MLILGTLIFPQTVTAVEYKDAYTFYETYADAMKFVPSTETDGNIYYATKGKKGYNVSTLYSTIGWKVSVKHKNGTVLQTLYFKLGGKYMQTINVKEKNGYEYSLYSISLSSIKNRMNQISKKALDSGNCTFIFDAGIAIKKSGKLQGAMNDNGVTSGTVYFTYNGIAKAAPWTAATKTALQSYYNRSVIGIFSTLTLSKDEGIASVSGSGTYCYGTEVVIEAVPAKGYTFASWSGSANYSTSRTTLRIGSSDISLTANSKLSSLLVTYFRNTSTSDTKTERQTFYYGNNPKNFKDFAWTKDGHYQVGWSLNKNASKPDYAITNSISDTWLLNHLPNVNLYAVWNVNEYKIIFEANGGSGEIGTINTDYISQITLPQNSFFYENGTFLGWSTNPLATNPEYQANQIISVKQLAEQMRVVNSNHAIITLYAIWDNAPAIAASDIYVSLQEAKTGKITEIKLASYAKAMDREDGIIAYGIHDKNSFLIENYETETFTTLEKEAEIKITFSVKDSSGNICKKEITVFVVDDDLYKEKEKIGKVRFISEKYYKDESGTFISEEKGGLIEDSIWKTDMYQAILDKLFQ